MTAVTPQTGETEAPKAPENNANPQGTPAQEPVKAEESSVVEQMRKELEQTRLRANQLENEKKQREEADASRKAKELEEQSEFKTLYEQERARREEIEAEREREEQTKELNTARTELLAEYSEEVRSLAEEVGVDLTATDENAKASFKEKLDKINARVANTQNVTPNNRLATNEKPELSGDDLKLALKSEKDFHDLVVERFPGIAAMTNQQK